MFPFDLPEQGHTRRGHAQLNLLRMSGAHWCRVRGGSQRTKFGIRLGLETVLNLHWFCHAEFRLDRISVILS